MQEQWKDIDNSFGLYQVSSLGNLRSKRVKGTANAVSEQWRKLKPISSGYGYLRASVNGGKYAIEGRKFIRYSLHILVWNTFVGKVPDGFELDHIDMDKHNCALTNLRLCTRGDNMRNRSKNVSRRGVRPSSKFKGVFWNKSKSKWEAGICFNYQKSYLGRFTSEEQAALAYNKAATKYFGEFARLNLINY